MINRTGVLIFIGFFLLGIALIFLGIYKSEQWFQTTNLQTHWQKGSDFLKIKKIGISKTVISPKNVHFSCEIQKSYILIKLNDSKQILKEHLSKISGHIADSAMNPDLLSFKGKEGVLNYHDYSLTINDCLFNIETPTQDSDRVKQDSSFHSGLSSKGGMKVLTLSLLKIKN